MIELKINRMPVRVEDGATILEAAESVGVEIPTLCHLKGAPPETSCMLCVVKDTSTGRLIPACSARVAEGMEIDTECAEVQAARRDILNLLLSEHVGDCEAPCTRVCPAHLDIPYMLREIARGNMAAAAWVARRDLAIPAVLGHVCPAPCEKGCRRAQVDRAITIRELHRSVGSACSPNAPQTAGTAVPASRAAVIGSGAAGLAGAWQLLQLGYGCTVFDEAPQAGGSLRKHADLPEAVLDAEVEGLAQAGIEFRLGAAISMQEIADDFAGVIFAEAEFSGVHFADAFYAEEHRLTVKAVANGKAAATALDRFLRDKPPAQERFDSRIGKLKASEIEELRKNCDTVTEALDAAGEAARCLHCDCRKPQSCKLRKYAEHYGGDPRVYPPDERSHLQLIGHNEAVIFEPGKCIKCGLCIKVTRQAGEELGLTFTGRGFNTKVTVPFGEALQNGLRKAAQQCVAICPTGALAFRDAEERMVLQGRKAAAGAES